MLGDRAKAFLKRHPPFSLLEDEALQGFVGSLRMHIYPAGVHILRQGVACGRALYIIREGTVKIYARSAAGEEQVLDFRGAGDTFGTLALGEQEPAEASVQAVSDVVCYAADGASALRLVGEHPTLGEYLLPAFFPKRHTEPASASPARDLLHEGSEKVLFTTPVEHLATRDVLSLPSGATALEAARMMAAHRVGAVVVLDAAGQPAGIVTTTDLRDRVLVAARDPAVAVAQIMSAPLITVAARDFCFEALLKMLSHDVHHLPVTDGGRLAGIVSNHDFLVLQGTSPLVIAREIEGQSTVEGLAASSQRVKGLVSLLLREGAGAGSIIRVISAVNDRIERRILDLALRTLGSPPVPFCWLVYGSAGRKEQAFKTDQDNAVVYADPSGEQQARAAEDYFGRFATFVVDASLRCGFTLCKGDFMATNPRWRQPLSAWKRTFVGWILTPDFPALSQALNLFDFRGLHGDLRLAAELRAHLQRALPGRAMFLKAVAEMAVEYRPPLGLFGSLLLEKSGEHAHQVDLKRYCLTPLINIVRLFSFESAIAETSTIERLAVLKAVHPIAKSLGGDLAHAFEFISLLRIRHQHEQIAMDLAPDNFIDPRSLSSLELRNLKEICRLLAKSLSLIAERYGV